MTRPSDESQSSMTLTKEVDSGESFNRLLSATGVQNSVELSTAVRDWHLGNWSKLSDLQLSQDSEPAVSGRLAVFKAAGLLQLGKLHEAKEIINLAKELIPNTSWVSKILVSLVSNTLAKSFVLKGEQEKANYYFENSVTIDGLCIVDKDIIYTRTLSEISTLGLTKETLNILSSWQGVELACIKSTNANEDSKSQILRKLSDVANHLSWQPMKFDSRKFDNAGVVNQFYFRCIRSEDILADIDDILLSKEISHITKFELCIRLTHYFWILNDKLMCQHCLNTAVSFLSEQEQIRKQQRLDVAQMTARIGRGHEALLQGLFALGDMEGVESHVATEFAQTYASLLEEKQKKHAHGHDLLISYIEANHQSDENKNLLVEIGTTRENVAGQGSTQLLANMCKRHNLDFVTVDMDEHNGRVANALFDKSGLNFKAITQKGEDYLVGFKGEFKYLFLDAYDFDHGMHSPLRQSRYIKFLGSKIDEEQCHQMHLDCAKQVLRKLSKGGVVCIDDTWIDGDKWTAKGTLAVPFLLDNNFEIIEARNRAVLMRRKESQIAES